MDNQARSHYAELGTLGSGYSEQGPFHCEDCVHKPASDAPYCNHLVVVADPELQSRRSGDLVKINLKKGCCRFVRPPEVIALVLRHGTTQLNEENKLRSRLDVPLDDEGLRQANEAAKFIAANYPDIKRIYVAPLQRTQQTAQPIAELLGVTPELNEALTTWDMGILIGADKDEVKDTLNYFVEHPEIPIPKGESLNEHVGEMIASVQPLLEQAEEDGPILLCMTSSSIIPLLKLIDGTPIEQPTDTYGIGPGGVMAISTEGDGYKMLPIFGEVKPAEVGAS